MSESAEASERLLDVVGSLELLAKDRTPAQASEELDPIVLQAFWREWPHASVWAGTLWRMLNRDLAEPAAQQKDPELDEIGGVG